jgi:hypothetical protein
MRTIIEHWCTEDMKPDKNADAKSNRIKDPDDWVTGSEEMTGAQASYLQTLAEEPHEPVELDLTKAEASKKMIGSKRRPGGPASPRGHETPAVGGRSAMVKRDLVT